MPITAFLTDLDRSLGVFIAGHGALVYALLFAVVFCEMAFAPLFFLPGDPLIIVAGAYAAQGLVDAGVVAATLWVAALGGSLTAHAIGRAIGRRVWTHDYRWINRAALERSHAWFERHGAATLVVSPFVGVLRTFTPLVAGICVMDERRFRRFATAGCTAWIGLLVPLGYFFGNLPLIRNHLNALVLAGLAVGLALLAGGAVFRRATARRARSSGASPGGSHTETRTEPDLPL